MNSLLLYPEEVDSEGVVRLIGPRARHAGGDFDQVTVGTSIPAAILGGARGRVTYRRLDRDEVELLFEQTAPAMPRNPVSLIVSVCRPQTMKKVIQASVFLGVEQLTFMRADRTEKSYLSSRELRSERIRDETQLAIEQCCDSSGPVISFQPSLGEVLAVSRGAGRAFFADTVGSTELGAMELASDAPTVLDGYLTLAIGPEKGWSSREQRLFSERGFLSLSLGERVLRVDAAVYVGIAALLPDAFLGKRMTRQRTTSGAASSP